MARLAATTGVRSPRRGSVAPSVTQGGDDGFRGDVADQDILREGAAAEAADGGVKAAAAGTLGGGDLCGGFLRARVQMHAEVYDAGPLAMMAAMTSSTSSGVARPTVSASEMVSMPVSASRSQAATTSSTLHGSP